MRFCREHSVFHVVLTVQLLSIAGTEDTSTGYQTKVRWPGSDQSAIGSAEIYLRAVHPGFLEEKTKTVTIMLKLCSVGLCRNSSADTSAHSLLSQTNRNTTIILQQWHTTFVFPHKEPGCCIACIHREGSVQLLLFLAALCLIYVSSVRECCTFDGVSCITLLSWAHSSIIQPLMLHFENIYHTLTFNQWMLYSNSEHLLLTEKHHGQHWVLQQQQPGVEPEA